MTPDVFFALTKAPSVHQEKLVNQIYWHAHEIVESLEKNAHHGEDMNAAIACLYQAITHAEKSLALAEHLLWEQNEEPKSRRCELRRGKKISISSDQSTLSEMEGLIAEAFSCLDDYEDATGETIDSLRNNLFNSFAEIESLLDSGRSEKKMKETGSRKQLQQ